jgi:hypothetical protein
MILHRKDIEKITAALEQFSDVDAFELDVHHSSGMGSITTMTFNQEVNGETMTYMNQLLLIVAVSCILGFTGGLLTGKSLLDLLF